MTLKRTLSTSLVIMLSIILASSLSNASIPGQCRIDGVPRVRQLPNYCGPAALTAVLRHEGVRISQETIARTVYDPVIRGTDGRDMLLYARQMGFSAYSWNANVGDVKRKIAAGAVVLVLQQNSEADTSGHFRVLTGYDDTTAKFSVMDPYYDITEISYARCERLSKRMGFWAMVVVPTGKDTFHTALSQRNPVVHTDLAAALYKRKDFDCALREAREAVMLEPGNHFALSLLNKMKAVGSGRNQSKEHLVPS